MAKEPIKKSTKKKKGAGGRPTVMTEFTIKKLEDAFLLGCTDREASLFAGITPQTLYNYCIQNPEYLERKELLKENPFLIARKSLYEGMAEDGNLALKYMERKKKEEFGTKTTVEQEVQMKVVSEEKKSKVIELLNKINGAN